jgi:hypothetical protein
MKKRNPLAVFFLGIITFGIYDLYWLYSTKKVLNEKTKFHTPTIWLLIVPFIVLIAGYTTLFTAAGLSNTSNSYGPTTVNNSSSNHIAHPGIFFASLVFIFIGFLATFVISIFWFFRFSKAINEYTQGKMSTAISFLILWLIHLIGVALIQDTFNDMSEGGPPNQAVPVAASVPQPVSQQPTNTPDTAPPQPAVSPIQSPPNPVPIDPSQQVTQDSPNVNNHDQS